MQYQYPVYQPLLDGNEKNYVNECLDSTWISSKGRFISEFESKFSEFTKIKYSIAVPNGTIALHLALLTLGVGKGDEVIVPTLSYVASANAVTYTGANPVFVDSMYGTWQIDPSDVRKKITKRTKAVMPVHLYGFPSDMNEIKKIAGENNLLIIEDCAEAFGTKLQEKHIGNFGNISAFSFFGNKTITTGEGGMVSTNNKKLFQLATRLKGQGLAKNREYWHDIVGYNYRMTNICAAIGLAQLERAEMIISRKRQIAEWYHTLLSDLSVEFHQEVQGIFHSYWMVNFLVNNYKDRDKLRDHLKKNGIETRPVFFPIHTMPIYRNNKHKFPVAEDIARRGITLPSYPGLTREDVLFISNKIRDYYN
jgi:perosamine synthetase